MPVDMFRTPSQEEINDVIDEAKRATMAAAEVRSNDEHLAAYEKTVSLDSLQRHREEVSAQYPAEQVADLAAWEQEMKTVVQPSHEQMLIDDINRKTPQEIANDLSQTGINVVQSRHAVLINY